MQRNWTSDIPGGKAKWCSHLENYPNKVAWSISMWSSNSNPPRYIPQGNGDVCLCKDLYWILYMNVHNSSVHDGQDMETTQMSITWWMDKQNIVYPYGLLLSHKTDEALIQTTTLMNLNNILSEKPDTKGYILHDSIYTKCPEQANS